MFKPAIEYEPREVIKKFQEEKMIELLQYLQAKSPFYKNMFAKEHIDINKIKTLEDLRYIPFTTKEDLQTHNMDFLCVDRSQVVDYMSTSGTLSEPTTFAATANDWKRLAYNEAISFTCADGKLGEVYQLMTTLDKRFMAGLAYFEGVKMMGGSVIRVGNGIPALQWETINRLKPDAIICVPSFILRIIKFAEENGIDYKNCSVKKAVCIGENLRDENYNLNLLGNRIREKWDIKLYSTYASTEMGTSFCECGAGKGGHHHPELIICEIIDENGNPVKEGEYGELTVCTLGVEGMPLLRFRTGDIACFHYEPCSCGRTTMRISPLKGRKNQMLKVKGTTLYPAAIFDVLDNVEYVENYLVEAETNEIGMDNVSVSIGCKNPNEELIKDLKDRFRARIRIAPDVKFAPIDEINRRNFPEAKRKPIKFFDNRKK